MPFNRLVFFFRYYPMKPPAKYLSLLFGMLGALLGYYIWFFHSPNPLANVAVIFLFIPSSMALVSVLFDKVHLMVLAILFGLPSLPELHALLIYGPFFCYLLSILLSIKKTLTRRDKAALEKLIMEKLMSIEGELRDKWKVVEFAQMAPDEEQFAQMYRIHLDIGCGIKEDYDRLLAEKGPKYANTYRLGVFYFITRSHSIWDLKRVIGDTSLYSFKGTSMSGEYIGNHHFGYVGRACGFSCRTLQIAAGMYQVYSKTSKWWYVFSYFDGPEDSKAICDGCRDYDQGYRF